MLVFNWLFVPPRHTFHVLLDQDFLLLVTMLGVSSVVSFLMARWRKAAEQEHQLAQHSEQLRQLGAQFHETPDSQAQVQLLRSVIEHPGHHSVAVLLLNDPTPLASSVDIQE